MSFIAKCYNSHKILLDDELEGATVECPICGEDFIATSQYEELGNVNERAVPYDTRGYIHMGTGLLIGGLLTYLITAISNYSTHSFWKVITFFTFSIGCLYFIRGVFELFKNSDPFWRVKQLFFAGFYVLWKKIKFFRR